WGAAWGRRWRRWRSACTRPSRSPARSCSWPRARPRRSTEPRWWRASAGWLAPASRSERGRRHPDPPGEGGRRAAWAGARGGDAMGASTAVALAEPSEWGVEGEQPGGGGEAGAEE